MDKNEQNAILAKIAISLSNQNILKNMTNTDLAFVVEDELWMKTRGGTRENDILSVVIERLKGKKGVIENA